MENKLIFTRGFKLCFMISISVFLLSGFSSYSHGKKKMINDSLSVKNEGVTDTPPAAKENDKGKMPDMFVHPFLTHMALTDPPGSMSLRITPFQQRHDSTVEQDVAVHIEAGIIPGLGIHIRSDGIKTSAYSEFMLMYSFLHDADYNNGLSVFGQVGIPTGPGVKSNALKYLFGFSGRLTIPKIVVMDANMHINLAEKMAEYESSFVFKASKMLYPILELRGVITEKTTSLYSLIGLKFRIADEMAVGVGIQTPITTAREYDSQALMSIGIAF
jgi:hypothetical protein